MTKDDLPFTEEQQLNHYLAIEQAKAKSQAELSVKLNTVLLRMDSIQEMEELIGKVNLTPEEVERVYG